MPSHSFMQQTTALLPTCTKINPTHPETAEYFSTDLTALVLQDVTRHGRVVVATTAGSFDYHKLDERIHARHDQRCSDIGTFAVIGIVSFTTGDRVGQVPDRKLPHWVFK